MPTNPYTNIDPPYEPEMMRALQGTPAGAAIGPTRRGTPYEALAQLAQWMGLALPGRGGMTPPPRRVGPSPKRPPSFGKDIDQAVLNWIRENVVGKKLPEAQASYDISTPLPSDPLLTLTNPSTELGIYQNLLANLFAQTMRRMAPRQGPAHFSSSSAGSTGRVAALETPGMPVNATHNPIFWLVEP